jgi:hypothetical protein
MAMLVITRLGISMIKFRTTPAEIPSGDVRAGHRKTVSRQSSKHPWCWYINANIKGVYWWDPWSTIYSSTMDPSWGSQTVWILDSLGKILGKQSKQSITEKLPTSLWTLDPPPERPGCRCCIGWAVLQESNDHPQDKWQHDGSQESNPVI